MIDSETIIIILIPLLYFVFPISIFIIVTRYNVKKYNDIGTIHHRVLIVLISTILLFILFLVIGILDNAYYIGFLDVIFGPHSAENWGFGFLILGLLLGIPTICCIGILYIVLKIINR